MEGEVKKSPHRATASLTPSLLGLILPGMPGPGKTGLQQIKKADARHENARTIEPAVNLRKKSTGVTAELQAARAAFAGLLRAPDHINPHGYLILDGNG